MPTPYISRSRIASYDLSVHSPTHFLFPAAGMMQNAIDESQNFFGVKGMKVCDTCFGEGFMTCAAHSPPTSLSLTVEESFDGDCTHISPYLMKIIDNPLASISFATEKL